MAERLYPLQVGFTLLEVVVAMAVAGLVLGAAMQLIGAGAHAAATLNTHRRALLVAESHLESIAAQTELAVGTTNGTTTDKFRWQATVEPLELPDADDARNTPFQLYAVSVEVLWGDERNSRRVRLASVRLARQQ